MRDSKMTEEEAIPPSPQEGLNGEVRSLQEKLRTHSHSLAKWGRMLNALLALLEEKGIASKDEVTMKVYERLRDSGALERGDGLDQAS
jgi:hypothetical protein